MSKSKMKRGIKILIILGITIGLWFSGSLQINAEEYKFDALNRVIQVTYEDGSYVKYTYDSNGNIVKTEVYEAPKKPNGPTNPANPANPTVPGNPGNGNTPGEGNTPGNGNNPGGENTPGEGNTPGNGNNPGGENTPDEGNTPSNGNTPGNGNTSGGGSTPGNENYPDDGNDSLVNETAPLIRIAKKTKHAFENSAKKIAGILGSM